MDIPSSALFFDVRKHGLQTVSGRTLGLTGAFTVEAWVMVESFHDDDQTVLATDDGGVRCLIRERKATLQIGAVSVSTEVNLKPNRWYHLAWRFHRAADELSVYVDGLADIRLTASTRYDGDATVTIGKGVGRTGLFGGIAELRVWRYVRSDDDLRASSYHDVEVDPPGLAAHWRPGEANGQSVPDLSGNLRHAVFILNPAVRPAKLPDLDEVPRFGPNDRSALAFPDDTTHVRLLSAAQLGLTDASFTVEAWVKLAAKRADDESVFGTNGYFEDDALTLSVRNRRLYMGFGNNNELTASGLLPLDVWMHLVWRYDRAQQEMALFVDGEKVASAGSRPPLRAKGTLNIARSQTHQQLYGSIAEVRTWDHARADADIDAGRAEPPSPSEYGLTGYWKPGEVAGRTVPDRSRWGRHGILEGTAYAEPAPGVPPGPKASLPPLEGMYACTHLKLYRFDPVQRETTWIANFHSAVDAAVKVYGLAFLPSGRCVAMAKWRLFDCNLTNGELTEIGRTNGNVYAITGLPDGRLIGIGASVVVELNPDDASERVLWEIEHENYGDICVLPDLRLLAAQVIERSYNFGGNETDPEVLGRSEWQFVDLDNQQIIKLERVHRAIGGLEYADGPLLCAVDQETAIVDPVDRLLSGLKRHQVAGRFTGLAVKRRGA